MKKRREKTMSDIKVGAVVESAEATHNLTRDFMKTPDVIPEPPTHATLFVKTPMKDVMEYCKINPEKAMGISLGVGAIMGMMLAKIFSRRPSA